MAMKLNFRKLMEKAEVKTSNLYCKRKESQSNNCKVDGYMQNLNLASAWLFSLCLYVTTVYNSNLRELNTLTQTKYQCTKIKINFLKSGSILVRKNLSTMFKNKTKTWASKIAASANLSSISGTHKKIEGESQFHEVVLWSQHTAWHKHILAPDMLVILWIKLCTSRKHIHRPK